MLEEQRRYCCLHCLHEGRAEDWEGEEVKICKIWSCKSGNAHPSVDSNTVWITRDSLDRYHLIWIYIQQEYHNASKSRRCCISLSKSTDLIRYTQEVY